MKPRRLRFGAVLAVCAAPVILASCAGTARKTGEVNAPRGAADASHASSPADQAPGAAQAPPAADSPVGRRSGLGREDAEVAQADEPPTVEQDPIDPALVIGPVAESPGVSASIEETASAPARTAGRRVTGRPLWWFAEVRRSQGVVRVCAEGIGMTANHALENATSRALRRAGLDPTSRPNDFERTMRVEQLPHRSVSRNRWVAYVMLEVSDTDR